MFPLPLIPFHSFRPRNIRIFWIENTYILQLVKSTFKVHWFFWLPYAEKHMYVAWKIECQHSKVYFYTMKLINMLTILGHQLIKCEFKMETIWLATPTESLNQTCWDIVFVKTGFPGGHFLLLPLRPPPGLAILRCHRRRHKTLVRHLADFPDANSRIFSFAKKNQC